MCPRKHSSRRGATLIEVLTSALITVLVLGTVLGIVFAGSSSWARGMGKIGAETGSQQAVRIVSQKLQEAMAVSVDQNGMGLTYRVPEKDGSGAFVVPLAWDGVTRRIQARGNELIELEGGSARVIASGLILKDPVSLKGSRPYVLFTPGPGQITRQVTIEVATRRYGFRAKTVANRSRETIFLRNIPQLTQ